MNKDPHNKTCKYEPCKKNFVGRLNQTYCCPNCKKKANNYKAAAMRKIFKDVNANLQFNWHVIDAFYESGFLEVTTDQLAGNGYNFDCMTNVFTAASTAQGPEIYNYQLEPIGNSKLKISKK